MAKKRTKSATVKVPKIDITESSDFRAVYASGVFGGLDPNDGRMVFFLDRIKPKMKSYKKNVMQLEKVNRELQVEVHKV